MAGQIDKQAPRIRKSRKKKKSRTEGMFPLFGVELFTVTLIFCPVSSSSESDCSYSKRKTSQKSAAEVVAKVCLLPNALEISLIEVD
jgi:hypothetical protein